MKKQVESTAKQKTTVDARKKRKKKKEEVHRWRLYRKKNFDGEKALAGQKWLQTISSLRVVNNMKTLLKVECIFVKSSSISSLKVRV
jgi:hypothetical protein